MSGPLADQGAVPIRGGGAGAERTILGGDKGLVRPADAPVEGVGHIIAAVDAGRHLAEPPAWEPDIAPIRQRRIMHSWPGASFIFFFLPLAAPEHLTPPWRAGGGAG